MRCDSCGAKFREELGFVKQKRNYTERFTTKIIQEVIESDLKVEGLFSLGDWLRDAKEYFPKSSSTIRRWLGQIIAYFDYRTTQGIVEGIKTNLS